MKKKTCCQFCKRKTNHWKYCYIRGFEVGLKMRNNEKIIVKDCEKPIWIDTSNKWRL